MKGIADTGFLVAFANLGEDLHRVEITLEGAGLIRQTADVRFPFRFTGEDQRDLRWYSL